MEKREPVLSMRDLAVSFQASFGKIRAVRGVNMDVYPGETVAIVGESGSGKSVSVKTIMGITAPNAVIESGTIKFRFKENGKEQVVDLLKLSKKEMQHRIKGKRIAMVFQDPMTSLDPTMTIGRQLTEGMRYHLHLSQADADKRAEELLETLYGKYRMYLVTNGTLSVQKGRLKSSGISRYFEDIFISEELGYNKPGREYFDCCFSRIPDFHKETAVIVGDSLTSDIQGGINAGIRTIWFNPSHEKTSEIIPDHEFDSLMKLPELLSHI